MKHRALKNINARNGQSADKKKENEHFLKKPLTTNEMQAVKTPKIDTKFIQKDFELTGSEANNLAYVLNSFQNMNKALDSNIAKWIAKNSTKLKAAVDGRNIALKEVVKEYVALHEGKEVYWDGNEEHDKATVRDNMLYSVNTGIAIAGPLLELYKYHVEDPKRKEEYLAKTGAINEKKYTITISQINQEFFGAVNVPAQTDLISLYDVLSFDENEPNNE